PKLARMGPTVARGGKSSQGVPVVSLVPFLKRVEAHRRARLDSAVELLVPWTWSWRWGPRLGRELGYGPDFSVRVSPRSRISRPVPPIAVDLTEVCAEVQRQLAHASTCRRARS